MEAFKISYTCNQSLEIICMAITLITVFIQVLDRRHPLKKGSNHHYGAFYWASAFSLLVNVLRLLSKYVNQKCHIAFGNQLPKIVMLTRLLQKSRWWEENFKHIRKKYTSNLSWVTWLSFNRYSCQCGIQQANWHQYWTVFLSTKDQ